MVDQRVAPIALGVIGAIIGVRVMGLVGIPAGAIVAAAIPITRRRRKAARSGQQLEEQFAELVEAIALAVRAGLSVPQAVEFAAGEADEPMSGSLEQLFRDQRLGGAFEGALGRFVERLDTDDARLFALVVTVHGRSGGDVAGALEEVVTTIRHRIALRRELRALSAQGRVSGTVLGSLPLFFFVVLAATSRAELEPVYRSAVGVAMIGGGLAMQGLAYLWIRRLLRVETS
jgi:tight adherence protein B